MHKFTEASTFLATGHKGWIMDAIAKNSAAAIGIHPRFQYITFSRREILSPSNFKTRFFPKFSPVNLFMHHSTFIKIADQHDLKLFKNFVFVTHFEKPMRNMLPEIRKLMNADRILVQNTNNARMIEQLGFDPKNISVVYGAVDRKFYFPESASTLKQELFVLIVGDCKPRKNPKLIERVIDFMPDVKFIIHGKNWQAYTTLGSVPRKNVQILDFQLARNPTLMRTASTVLSLAENEGGPFPLLEALASGTPVVATDTGFSADLISKLNGVLLSQNPKLDQISAAIRRSVKLKNEVSSKDLLGGKYTWSDLGKQLYKGTNLGHLDDE
jgi:glycosyltransferase involved in cell wall biosynthesis